MHYLKKRKLEKLRLFLLNLTYFFENLIESILILNNYMLWYYNRNICFFLHRCKSPIFDFNVFFLELCSIGYIIMLETRYTVIKCRNILKFKYNNYIFRIN